MHYYNACIIFTVVPPNTARAEYVALLKVNYNLISSSNPRGYILT